MDRIVMKIDDTDVGNIVSQGVGALGRIDSQDIVPPVLGGVVTFGSTLLIRKFGKTNPGVVKYAPLIGIVPGTVISMLLVKWGGKKAVIAGTAASAVVGAGLYAYERISMTAWATSGLGYTAVSEQRRLRGIGEARVEQIRGRGPMRVLPTTNMPGGMQSAIDVFAFAGRP